jgi:N6-L-threonylcarbamoyladenine synthase
MTAASHECNTQASRCKTEHHRHGDVVSEVASRAHLERMDGVVQKALDDAGARLDDVERVAVTARRVF